MTLAFHHQNYYNQYMEYRRIGNTDIQASVIGLGCEGFEKRDQNETNRMIDAAISGGINMLDLFSPNTNTRQRIGAALKGRRDTMRIQAHIGSTDIHEQNDVSRDLKLCKKYFESYYTDLKTDYLDFGMFFFVDTQDDFHAVFDTDLAEYAMRLKEKGMIRAIGASSHNSVIAKQIANTGIVDLIMFSVNPVFDMTPSQSDIFELFLEKDDFAKKFTLRLNPERAALYTACAERGVSVTVMKALCAGRLLDADLSPFGTAMTVGQCVSYALSRPSVASVLLGASSEAEIQEALHYFSLSEAEKDYGAVLRDVEGAVSGACMYCNHCQPCPAGIDVAAVTKYADIADAAAGAGAVPPAIRRQYAALAKHGGDCVQCGACEKRCPFAVKVGANMARAKGLFGL
jgi:predicted aldo/keto reductase-like oxidoreductase